MSKNGKNEILSQSKSTLNNTTLVMWRLELVLEVPSSRHCTSARFQKFAPAIPTHTGDTTPPVQASGADDHSSQPFKVECPARRAHVCASTDPESNSAAGSQVRMKTLCQAPAAIPGRHADRASSPSGRSKQLHGASSLWAAPMVTNQDVPETSSSKVLWGVPANTCSYVHLHGHELSQNVAGKSKYDIAFEADF
ncbi:hypothetical protein BKA93DRAFT_881442 [Sparassis latifolia]